MTSILSLLSPEAQKQARAHKARRLISQATRRELWRPIANSPQELATRLQCDVLGYGGAAGGGKTDLALGLAATQHKRSVIFRRTFPQMREIIERSRQIFNPDGDKRSEDSYNESLHRWKLSDGRIIEFESCQYEKDKEKQRGRPRDLYVFDEATEFTRTQIEFITAWNRSTDPNQFCRVVLTFNPPTDAEGEWIIDYFRPWLSGLFEGIEYDGVPAMPGEIRWFARIDGKECEVKSGESFKHDGETIYPRSRSFIPAKLDDNPYLRDTNYKAILQSMPEPLRSQLLYGDFTATAEDDVWQVIPTQWVKLAQKRWRESEPPTDFITAVGIDPARGGGDKLAIARRRWWYFDQVAIYDGKDVQDGGAAAALVYREVPKEPDYINIDVIAIGSSPYDFIKDKFSHVSPVNAASRSGHMEKRGKIDKHVPYTDKSGKMTARNKRAEYHWRLREALDPDNGDNLALPPGHELLADLCAARYKLTSSGILIESKESIKERIGRSPDKGEAVMLANLPKQENKARKKSVWVN